MLVRLTRRARRLARVSRGEDGQAIVELALVLPILLLVLFGILDFGRAINYWNGENSLANAAARVAAVGSIPTTGPCAYNSAATNPLVTYINCEESGPYAIASVSSGNGLSESSPCVSVPTDSPGQEVTVEVYGNYTWLPLPSLLGSSHANFATTKLAGTATMRIENSIPSSWITTASNCP